MTRITAHNEPTSPLKAASAMFMLCLLFWSQAAHPAVVYSGSKNITLLSGDTFSLDLESGNYASGFRPVTDWDVRWEPGLFFTRADGAMASEEYQVSAYPPGASIGPISPASDVTRYLQSVSGRRLSRGLQGAASIRIFGFRFTSSTTGSTHYGWVRINLPTQIYVGQTEIIDWAWEDTPNTPIPAVSTGAGAGGTPPQSNCVQLSQAPGENTDVTALAYPGSACTEIQLSQPSSTTVKGDFDDPTLFAPWQGLTVRGVSGQRTPWDWRGLSPTTLGPAIQRATLNSIHLIDTELNTNQGGNDGVRLSLQGDPELILENSSYLGYQQYADIVVYADTGLHIEGRSGDNVIGMRGEQTLIEPTLLVKPNASLSMPLLGQKLINQISPVNRSFNLSRATVDVDGGTLNIGDPAKPDFGSTVVLNGAAPGSIRIRNQGQLTVNGLYSSLRVLGAPLELENSTLLLNAGIGKLDTESITLTNSDITVARGDFQVTAATGGGTQVVGSSSINVVEVDVTATLKYDVAIAANSTLTFKGRADNIRPRPGRSYVEFGPVTGVDASSKLVVTTDAVVRFSGYPDMFPMLTSTGGTFETTEGGSARINNILVPVTAGPIINNGRIEFLNAHFEDDYRITRRPSGSRGLTVFSRSLEIDSTLTVETETTVTGDMKITLDLAASALTASQLASEGALYLGELGASQEPSLQIHTQNDRALPQGTRFVIADYPDAALTGEFDGHPDGSVLRIGQNHFRIDYSDPTDVVNPSVITLTSVSENITAVLDYTINSGADGIPSAGETITLKIDIGNSGTLLADVLAVDMAPGPPGLTDCGSTFGLLPGATRECSIDYTLTQQDIDRGFIVHTARVVSNAGADITGSQQITIPQVLDVSIDVIANFSSGYAAPTQPGNTVDYFLRLTNTGNMPLSRIDKYVGIAGTELLLTDPQYDGSTADQLAPGASFDTSPNQYSVLQEDIDLGEIIFTPRAELMTGGTTLESVNGTSLALPLNLAPGVTVRSQGVVDFGNDNDVDAGDLVHFTVTVSNSGNTSLFDIRVSDPLLPGGFSCPLPLAISPGRSLTCTGDVAVTQDNINAGRLDNTTTVQATPGTISTIGPDVSDSDAGTTRIPQNPLLSLATAGQITQALATYPRRDDSVNLGFVLRNDGDEPLDQIALSSPIGPITCPESTLAINDSMTCTGETVLHQPDLDSGQLSIVTTATANSPSGTVSATDSFQLALLQVADVVLSKAGLLSASDQGIARVGDTISYAIGVFNLGNVELTSVAVNDPLIPGLNCPFSSVSSGFLNICTGDYQITAADIAAGERDNSASVSAGSVVGTASDTTQFLLIFPLAPTEVPVTGAALLLGSGLGVALIGMVNLVRRRRVRA